MSEATDQTAKSRARTLAEAVILQSIEDLWSPVCKKGSMLFFQGDGFILCSELAGISYVKQLIMLRMLADAGQNRDKTEKTLVTSRLFCGNALKEKDAKDLNQGRCPWQLVKSRYISRTVQG